MKDTYNFPLTLRNYEDQSSKHDHLVSPSHQTKTNKSLSASTYHPKKIVQQQDHNVGEYYILTNPSQFRPKQKKTKKTKSKSKESHFSQALREQLKKPLFSNSQIGPQNIVHCKSLQKLQIISNDRSQEIKSLINEKALLYAQNQELKAKINNPTFRQQQFIQKIAQRQIQIEGLKESLRRKDEMIAEVQRQYKVEIQRIKAKHKEEMANLREQINKLRLEKINETSRKYVTHTSVNGNNTNQRIIKAETTSYNPIITESRSSNFGNTKTYRTTQESSSPVVINSANYQANYKSFSYNDNKSPIRESLKLNDPKQAFRTYVGEDGYERRVYYKNGQNEDNAKVITSNEGNNALQVGNNLQSVRYSDQNNVSRAPFTNEKISTSVGAKQSTQTYKYSGTANHTTQYDPGLHNQNNLYSKSLTFQCFNDQH